MFEALSFCTCTCICLSLQEPTVVTHHAQIKFFIFFWSQVGLPSIGFVLDCTVLLIQIVFCVSLPSIFIFSCILSPLMFLVLLILIPLKLSSPSCMNPPVFSSFLCLCFQLSPFLLILRVNISCTLFLVLFPLACLLWLSSPVFHSTHDCLYFPDCPQYSGSYCILSSVPLTLPFELLPAVW